MSVYLIVIAIIALVCLSAFFSGSEMAAQTLDLSDFSVRAPVGQTAMHCPQLTQGVSARDFPKGEATTVL